MEWFCHNCTEVFESEKTFAPCPKCGDGETIPQFLEYIDREFIAKKPKKMVDEVSENS